MILSEIAGECIASLLKKVVTLIPRPSLLKYGTIKWEYICSEN